MRNFLSLVIMMTLTVVFPAWSQASDEDIVVRDAWVRLQPPVRPNSSAYMTIENKSQTQAVLKSVTSKVVETVELHSMEHVDGVMKMRQVSEIKIPANGQVELKPGGLHLMLFGIQNPLAKGDVIELNLRFEDGRQSIVQAQIKDPDEALVIPDEHKMGK